VFLAYMRKEFTKKEVKWSYCRGYKKEFTSEELETYLQIKSPSFLGWKNYSF